MTRAFLLFIAGVVLAAPVAAQTQSIVVSGRVTDVATGKPLNMVAVRVFNSTFGATSNDSGFFSFTWRTQSTTSTEVEIQAQRVGYGEERRKVRVTGSAITVNFALRVGSLSLASTEFAKMQGQQGQASGSAGGRAGGGGRGGVAAAAPRQRSAVGPQWVTTSCPNASDCRPNTEAYDRIIDNPFLAAQSNALSTFSIDVDRASLSNVRRFIGMGQLPPKDAVRIEEMINYFPYEYPAPAADQPFSVTTEVAVTPWNRQHHLVRIGLQGRRIETASLPPSNLVFLVDVSGSMQVENKLPLVKTSLRMLVDQLREQDRVSMVVYAGSAGLVLEPTSGANKSVINQAIDRLEAGGSTAGGAGLRLAYAVARQFHVSDGNNRVILATDGDFNVGVSSDAEMERLVEEERKGGVFLTVLGYGMGNLKDSKLERIADKGNGNYAYIDDIAEARKTLVHEMGGTLFTIAKDVKLQVEFNPAHVQAYRLIGYENRLLRAEDFNDDKKDAGELGAGHSVTALYEVIPVGVRSNVAIRGLDSLRYQTPAPQTGAAAGSEMLFVKLRYKEPAGEASKLISHPVSDRVSTASQDLTFVAAIAEFGMLLRDSEYKGTSSVEDVLGLARLSVGADRNGYRADFVRLVESYQQLVSGASRRK